MINVLENVVLEKFEGLTKPLLAERFSREWARMKTGDPAWKPERRKCKWCEETCMGSAAGTY